MADEELEMPIKGVPKMPPGMRTLYVPNHRSFGAFMKSEQMRDVTAEVAAAIAADADATQPPAHSDTDPNRAGVSYTVEREAGQVKVAGNIRVRVRVWGKGEGAERAEFGDSGDGRYRTLGAAGARHGDFRHGEALG